METTQRLISEIVYVAIEESISEEPDVGNPQARFCEGHVPPNIQFNRMEATCLLDIK